MRNKLFLLTLAFILLAFSSCVNKEAAQDIQPESNILNLSDRGQKVTFIELGSVECIPCKAMVPVMEQVRAELEGQVEVVFHDVWTDEGSPYAREFKINVIPTQIFLDSQGNEYFRHEGFFPAEELYRVLEDGGVTLK